MYTTFLVWSFLVNTKSWLKFVALEQATYSWPCKKHSSLKSTPTVLQLWPCDLFSIVLAKQISEEIVVAYKG